jgi:chemotaxis protein methyltransferase CheR
MALEEAGIDPRVRVIASDVDTGALTAAQDGIYRMDRAATLGEERLRRFFLRGDGANYGHARVRPELRARVSFRHINLAEPKWNVAGPLAAIFCRNAMIYFARPTQLAVLQRFVPLMKGGGLLFAGHSENFHYLAGDFLRARGKTVYELVG